MIDQVVAEHDQLLEETDEARRKLINRRGPAALRLIEEAQLKLFEFEARGDFVHHDICPGREYPTLFTRIPIFLSCPREQAARRVDKNLAVPFDTGWGAGRKFGPPLTIYDEDTLLALGALRQMRLEGRGDKMPIRVSNPVDPQKTTHVDVLYTTTGEIERYLGKAKGGRGNARRLQSVKDLGNVNIEFTRINDNKKNPVIKAQTFSTKLIDVLSEELEDDACLYIQFPPIMVLWLRYQSTYIDMDIRRQLKGDHAKAIHKFLSSQPTFNIGAKKLAYEVLMFEKDYPLGKFMEKLRHAMEQLKSLGWCEYDIRGTGRKTPFVLTGRRLGKDPEKGN